METIRLEEAIEYNEPPKTSEELAFIKKANQWLSEEMVTLGIDLGKIESIDPRQIHYLQGDTFAAYFPRSEFLRGFARVDTGEIFIDKSKLDRLNVFTVTLHEMVHLKSYYGIKYHARKDIEFGVRGRSGYSTSYNIYKGREFNEKEEYEYFRGLNEAVTDRVMLDILIRNKEAFLRDFKVTQEERNKGIVYYRFFADILDTIIKRVSQMKNENEKETAIRFKKCLFTGEIMHLRDVERAYEKGALRIFASMGSIEPLENFNEDMAKKYKAYFSTEKKEERERIAQEILKGRELEKYKKRKE